MTSIEQKQAPRQLSEAQLENTVGGIVVLAAFAISSAVFSARGEGRKGLNAVNVKVA